MLPQAGCVGYFVVAVFGEALLEELVGQNTSLGEAIHCSSDLHVNKTVFGFSSEIILIDDVGRDDLKRDAHVFVSVEWCSEVEQFEICGEVAGVGGANDTVPEYFGSDQVSGASGEFTGVIDEVTTNGDADSIGVFLLRSVVNNNASIGYGSVRGDG